MRGFCNGVRFYLNSVTLCKIYVVRLQTVTSVASWDMTPCSLLPRLWRHTGYCYTFPAVYKVAERKFQRNVTTVHQSVCLSPCWVSAGPVCQFGTRSVTRMRVEQSWRKAVDVCRRQQRGKFWQRANEWLCALKNKKYSPQAFHYMMGYIHIQFPPHSEHPFTTTKGHLTPAGEVTFYSERRSDCMNIW